MIENEHFMYSFEEKRLRIIPKIDAKWEAKHLSTFLIELASFGGYPLEKILFDFSLNKLLPPAGSLRERVLARTKMDHQWSHAIKEVEVRGFPNMSKKVLSDFLSSIPEVSLVVQATYQQIE